MKRTRRREGRPRRERSQDLQWRASPEPDGSERSRPRGGGVVARIVVTGVALWLGIWWSQIDVALRISDGTRTGWWTARSSLIPNPKTPPNLRKALWFRPFETPHQSFPVGGFTDRAFDEIADAVRARGLPSIPGSEEAAIRETRALGDSTNRVFGRGHLAGLGRRIAYRFERLEPPVARDAWNHAGHPSALVGQVN